MNRWSLSRIHRIESKFPLHAMQSCARPSIPALPYSTPLPRICILVSRTLAECVSAHVIAPSVGIAICSLTDWWTHSVLTQLRFRASRKPDFTPVWSHDAFYTSLYILLSLPKNVQGSIMSNSSLGSWQTAGIHFCLSGQSARTTKLKVLSVCFWGSHKRTALLIPNILPTLCVAKMHCMSLLCGNIYGNIASTR